MFAGRAKVGGIAARYGMDCSGIESRCGRDFPHPSRGAWDPPSLQYNEYRVISVDNVARA